jgi:hypothetical protein
MDFTFLTDFIRGWTSRSHLPSLPNSNSKAGPITLRAGGASVIEQLRHWLPGNSFGDITFAFELHCIMPKQISAFADFCHFHI